MAGPELFARRFNNNNKRAHSGPFVCQEKFVRKPGHHAHGSWLRLRIFAFSPTKNLRQSRPFAGWLLTLPALPSHSGKKFGRFLPPGIWNFACWVRLSAGVYSCFFHSKTRQALGLEKVGLEVWKSWKKYGILFSVVAADPELIFLIA